MDKPGEHCTTIKLHPDVNNNHVLVKGQASSNTINSISNKIMTPIAKDISFNIANDLQNVNSIIQHSRIPKASLSNVHSVSNHEFIGPTVKTSSGENSQLVQILKPFYNSVQILEKPPLISNENSSLYLIDSDKKLNIVDTHNQTSLLSQSNDSYVHSLVNSVLNSEFLNNNKKTSSSSLATTLAATVPTVTDLVYQNVNYSSEIIHASTTPVPDNYFNEYGTSTTNEPNICNGAANTSQIVNGKTVASSLDFFPKINFNKNFQQHSIAQNSNPNNNNNNNNGITITRNPPTTGHSTRGRKKTKKGPFICSECRKEFCNQSTLTKHMITHSDERKFVCPQCNKAFKRHDHLNGHMLTHREHKPYACDIEGCDKSYCDARSLRRHKERHKENAANIDDNGYKLSSLLSTEKGNNISFQLPINASTQLQFLAFHQKKIPDSNAKTKDENVQLKETIVDDNNNKNFTNYQMNNDHHHLNKLITNIPLETSNHLHTENALLHQLLTGQEKNTIFNNRQPIGQNNSTVIKINDNYTCDDLTDSNYMHLFNSATKNNVDKHRHSSQQNHHQLSQTSITEEQKKLLRTDSLSIQNSKSLYTNEKAAQSFECMICLKKFPTLIMLNGHMKMHEIQNKSNTTFLLSNDELNKTDLNTHLNLSYDFNMKNYDLEMNKSFNYMNQQQQQSQQEQPQPQPSSKAFDEMNIYDKGNEIEFRNFNTSFRQFDSSSSSMPIMTTNDAKHDIINSGHIFPEQVIYENKNNQSNIVDAPNYEVPQTKGLNEVMFSPITPVTPLKNNSQFTFEFTNQPVKDSNQNSAKMDLNLCKNEQINYVPALDDTIHENFCFDSEKVDHLIQKNMVEINQTSTNFNQSLDDNGMGNFSAHENIEKNFAVPSSHNEYFDTNKDETAFNSFDFPSNKYTSDLFNRRAKKNADINKTKEMLSIKQIAASLQSFGQNYERNHQNHSMSVPTTPCISSAPIINHDPFPLSNLSHHSLPATPVEGTHFTFKTNSYNQVNSLPNTPVDNNNQQQFNFIFPPETEPQSNQDDLINTRNFDMNCLDDSNYSEYIYNSSKDIQNDYSDTDNINFKQNNSAIHYNSIENNVNQTNGSLPVNDINENVNFFNSTTELDYVENTNPTDGDCKLLNSIMDTYITPIKDFIHLNDNSNENGQICNSLSITEKLNDQDNRNIELIVKEPAKLSLDINANYVDNINENEHSNVKSNKCNENNENVCPQSKSPNLIKSLTKKLNSINASVTLKKKKPRPEPLYIPPHVSTSVYHSRLRSPRLWNVSKIEASKLQPPYTPPPMLSPVRSGSGLFWKINSNTCVSYLNSGASKIFNKKIKSDKDQTEPDLKTPTTAYEPYEYDIPQTDIEPHVNIGPNFQARIPAFNSNRAKLKLRTDCETLLWNPKVLNNIGGETLDQYLQLSCSLCVTGHGNNIEYALHLLHFCNGDVYEALRKLLNSKNCFNVNHPLSDYYYADHIVWSRDEIKSFQRNILTYDKDFFLIAKNIKTKSVKECIQFYYLWKKNSTDLFRHLRIIRRKRDSALYDFNNKNAKKSKNELCENVDCDENTKSNSNGVVSSNSRARTVYSCTVCRKRFKNSKSRSSHMKIHE